MALPTEPGLLRRLAYGRSVYYRNRQRNLIANHSHEYTRTRRNAIVHDLDQWQDRVQLSLCKLLENSIVCLGNNSSTCCVICLEDYQKKTIIRKLICNHTFHITCIETWLSNTTTCPICRFDLNV